MSKTELCAHAYSSECHHSVQAPLTLVGLPMATL